MTLRWLERRDVSYQCLLHYDADSLGLSPSAEDRPPLRPSAPPASQRAGAASPNCRLPAGRSVASTDVAAGGTICGTAAGGTICGAADSQRILARHVCAQRTAALQSVRDGWTAVSSAAAGAPHLQGLPASRGTSVEQSASVQCCRSTV